MLCTVLAVVIGFAGILLTGLVVALSVEALRVTAEMLKNETPLRLRLDPASVFREGKRGRNDRPECAEIRSRAFAPDRPRSCAPNRTGRLFGLRLQPIHIAF